MDAGIVIVGAGHAGDAVAAQLRQFGHAGPITLLGAERHRPYHRPPLSKTWLKGEGTEDTLALRPADFHARQAIDFRPGCSVTAIDRAGRRVHLASGEALAYATLILATGARPRALALPGAEMPHVHALRTRDDAERLRTALGPDRNLVLVGGGYIGLEIAASARALGTRVRVLERENRLLPRVASAELAGFFQSRHAAEGVDIRLGARPVEITRHGIRLADGALLAADAVLVGIGAVANIELAEASGLACDGGIVVDADARTADGAIFAIGDCTSRPVDGRRMRLESVPSALEQARRAAAAITGRPPPAAEVPWFWSDQYDIRLQIAGLLPPAPETVRRGDPASGRFALFHLRPDGTLAAVEAVNSPDAFAAGRAFIARHTLLAREKLADPSVPMTQAAA